MRRSAIILTAAIAAALPVCLHGQSVRLKGGFSYGDVSNRGVLPGNLGARSGFAAGVSVGTPGLLGLRVESLYAQRGVTNSSGTDSRKIDDLDVPVLAQVSVPTPLVAPFAYAGPQVSIELRCRAGDVACPDTDRSKTSFAGVIGAGATLGAFSLEGRYVYGVTDLKLSAVTSSDSYQTRSFMILAGVGF